MQPFFTEQYLINTFVGLLGLFLWFLKVRLTPSDDRITSLFLGIYEHSYSLAVALLTYALVSVLANQLGEWTMLAAVASGYSAQSAFGTLITKSPIPRGDID